MISLLCLQECTRTLPRGWPQPHLPLIAKYDLNAWPPANLSQLREELGVNVQDSLEELDQRGGESATTSYGSSRRSRRERAKKRTRDTEDVVRERVDISVGRHPSLKKRKQSNSSHSTSKLDRSMSFDAGLLMNRSSSLLETPPTQRTYDVSRSSSLLPMPATPPLGHMPPPTRSLSSRSAERRGEKRPLNDHHHHHHHHHHRGDSEPAKRLKLAHQEDFPREPMTAMPSRPYNDYEQNERLHHHHGNHHGYNQAHSLSHYNERHRPGPSPVNNQFSEEHHTNSEDARNFITARNNRRMSYEEERGAYNGMAPVPPPLYHRRLSDYSELAHGSSRTPPMIDRHKRHGTADGMMVNSRGFRGHPQLVKNNYRH